MQIILIRSKGGSGNGEAGVIFIIMSYATGTSYFRKKPSFVSSNLNLLRVPFGLPSSFFRCLFNTGAFVVLRFLYNFAFGIVRFV